MTPILVLPVLAGALWTILGIGILSLFCYREYARVTGLFRDKLVTSLVTLGILAITFATLDHWYGFFMALTPLITALIAAGAILSDRPKGYIQRVALGILGFMLFGCSLGHLGYIANDFNYRPVLLMLLVGVEMNDVFAYVSGKSFGHRKLAPNTSPNKTIGGALGALGLTTILTVFLGWNIFQGTRMASIPVLIGLGMIVSVVGQLGDLMLSSVKRDVGLKDVSQLIPGHGGLLDRFDSLILVAPAAFHYIGYFVGFGLDTSARIITGP